MKKLISFFVVLQLFLMFFSEASSPKSCICLKSHSSKKIEAKLNKVYTNELDVIGFEDGFFNIYFYCPFDVQVCDIYRTRILRADKKGIYFLISDVKDNFRDYTPQEIVDEQKEQSTN